jgi:uracil-DNA glycosylase family 4
MTPKAPHANCDACPLKKEQFAPSCGAVDAKIAFVSRSPGYYDVNANPPRPFAGPSGAVLDHLLKLYGVTREEILTTNVVLCNTDNPPQEAIEACATRLEVEIAETELVIAGGSEAIKSLIGGRWTVSSARGRNHQRTSIVGSTQRVVATSNPAVVLRKSENFPDLVKDFRLALDPIQPPERLPDVYTYDGVIEAIDFLKQLRYRAFTHPNIIIASDLETFQWSDRIACAGFSGNPMEAHVIGIEPLMHPEVMHHLKELYENLGIRWLWHNGKYDIKVLRRNGINARVDEDTFILSYACDERPGGSYTGDQGSGTHGLTPILMEDYGWPDYEPNSVKQFKKTGILDDPEALYRYNGLDTAGTLTIFPDLQSRATEDNVLSRPYYHSQVPLANALVQVELNGFCYDAEAAANLNESDILPKLWELADQMRELSEHSLLNPRSHVQISSLLYREWGLKHSLHDTIQSPNKSTASVDKDVRREILEGRYRANPGYKDKMLEFVKLYDIYAKVEKQRATSTEGLIRRVQPDGKLYSTFKFGTVSGRLSSENPNFQNITRSGSYGIPSIRTVFRPSDGNVLISADLSQAELRTIAKLSGDKALLAIYRDSTRSLHKERATRFYGENYTKEEYVKAKNINFGVTYGQSAYAFAQMYTMPEDEAQAYIDAWWRDFPGVRAWVQRTQQLVQKSGEVISPFGHKRRFHLITKENKNDVLREAVNFIPQNVAGVATELALVELVNAGVRVVTSVHDSIVADVPADEVFDVAKLMKETMEAQTVKHLGWQWEDIPFVADISVGDNWFDMEEVEDLATVS